MVILELYSWTGELGGFWLYAEAFEFWKVWQLHFHDAILYPAFCPAFTETSLQREDQED